MKNGESNKNNKLETSTNKLENLSLVTGSSTLLERPKV